MKINAHCPECGYEVNDASGVGDAAGARPEPDDNAVCIRCAGVGVYFVQDDNTLGLRLTTVEEKVELAENEELMKVRAMIIGQEIWLSHE